MTTTQTVQVATPLEELNARFSAVLDKTASRLSKINTKVRQIVRAGYQGAKRFVSWLLRGIGRGTKATGHAAYKGAGYLVRGVSWVLWGSLTVVGSTLSFVVLGSLSIVFAVASVPPVLLGYVYLWFSRQGRRFVLTPLGWVAFQPQEANGARMTLRDYRTHMTILDEDEFWTGVDTYIDEDEDYTPPPGIGLTSSAISSDDDPRLHRLSDNLMNDYELLVARIDYLVEHNGDHKSLSYWVGRANFLAEYLRDNDLLDDINSVYHGFKAHHGATSYVWAEVFRGHQEQANLLLERNRADH